MYSSYQNFVSSASKQATMHTMLINLTNPLLVNPCFSTVGAAASVLPCPYARTWIEMRNAQCYYGTQRRFLELTLILITTRCVSRCVTNFHISETSTLLGVRQVLTAFQLYHKNPTFSAPRVFSDDK
jgi:hypothetical protein